RLAGGRGIRLLCTSYIVRWDVRHSFRALAAWPLVRFDTPVDPNVEHHPCCGLLPSAFGVGKHCSRLGAWLRRLFILPEARDMGLGTSHRCPCLQIADLYRSVFICFVFEPVVSFFILLRHRTR